MAFPIRTPRVNNNDDVVRLSAVFPAPGAAVAAGGLVAEVETDKATFSVETDRAGFFLRCPYAVGDMVPVGSVLVWMGDTAGEAAPEEEAATGPAAGGGRAEPTLKAALLLKEYGLDAAQVPAAGERLSAAEVEAYIAARGLAPRGGTASSPVPAARPAAPPPPAIAGRREELNPQERGMLRTVSWHRDQAVPGYVEIAYDAAGWEKYGAMFQAEHKLLLNPVLSLMAFRLVELQRRNPKYNGTIHGESKFLYEAVHIGFTVQSGDYLYLAVVRDAHRLDARGFVARLLELQKAAMKNRLSPEESSGATMGFTSMARWGVTRHQPILPPHTSLMIAHAAPAAGQTVLGATYDHRLLSGADAVAALRLLQDPE